ncbi:MAG: cob(I)yrinic acid a,c-diamide adenosyltransferase [Oscillospiraceae bacterium]|nr:cob(I)yrinic acid a,c-diamide adenosyltransferase [Oscillospiraceae bacterium]MBR1897482.1 cob(I)yrinic acid a,c-diamide adenosyltransferase [Oscillospiraceae bacterium]
MLHIYCGDGKGKTTAALGLAVRAAGAGMRVHIVQLLKGSDTAELHALSYIPGITVTRLDRDYGFTFRMDAQTRQTVTELHNALLYEAYTRVKAGETDMLVLDEFCAAYEAGMVDPEFADLLVRNCTAELVLTGRRPAPQFVNAADYVSDIRAVKHPYDRGIAARKGIEF